MQRRALTLEGAMPGMGPAPKPASQRRRRNAVPGTIFLPAEGRKGRTPKWPLTGKPSRAESTLWAQLWRTPQAVAWDRFGWTRVVARYVRVTVCAEQMVGLPVTLSEARQLEDRLGLSPMSMLRLRWEIVEDELAARREPSAPATRSRPRIVDPKLAAVDA